MTDGDARRRVTILCRDLRPGPAVGSALALARWLHREHGRTAVEVVSLWGGPWQGAFEAVAGVHVVNDDQDDPARDSQPGETFDLDGVTRPVAGRRPSPRLRAADLVPIVLRDLKLRRAADGARGAFLRRRLGRDTSPIWLADASAARLLHYVPANRRVVAHRGEFAPPITTESGLTSADLTLLAERPDHWIAGGEESAAALRSWGVAAPVDVVPDLLLLDEEQPDCATVRARLAAEHDIAVDAPLVASSGAIDWWDVPDAFVQVAWDIHQRRGHEDVRFLWLGEHSTDQMLWPLRHDIGHAGLDGVVHVASTRSATSPLLTCADVVVLSRRGEWAPSDLRSLEAIATSLVRWALPGEEPGRRGSSTLVAPIDDGAMADAVLASLDRGHDGSAERRALGVRARHTARHVGPEILAILGEAAPSR